MCVVTGSKQYEALGKAYGLPFVVAGFEPCDAEWRGIGLIKGAGLKVREEYTLIPQG